METGSIGTLLFNYTPDTNMGVSHIQPCVFNCVMLLSFVVMGKTTSKLMPIPKTDDRWSHH